MASKDTLMFKEKIVGFLDDAAIECLTDENLFNIVTLLRNGPMTVNELYEEFEKQGNKKSDKTIYRYLNKLHDVGLVKPAGKRIINEKEDKIKTQTLYCRTAKIFFEQMDLPEDSLKKMEEMTGSSKRVHMLMEVLRNYEPGKEFDKEKFFEFYKNLRNKRNELLGKFADLFDPVKLKFLTDLQWKDLTFLIREIIWLSLLKEKDELGKTFEACFS